MYVVYLRMSRYWTRTLDVACGGQDVCHVRLQGHGYVVGPANQCKAGEGGGLGRRIV